MKFNSINVFVICTVFLVLLSFNASATMYNYLESPSLIGQMAGPDLLWDTSDDFTEIGGATGFNTFGGASGFLDESNNFGSITGSFRVSGSTVTSYDVNGEFSNLGPEPDIIAEPITESLTAGTTSTFNLGIGNTATSSMRLDVTSSFGTSSFTLSGFYNYLLPGDDPNVLFAGQTDLISQFNFLLPLLPSNWNAFFIGYDEYTFLDSGVNGNQQSVFYTTEAPEPMSVVILILGLAGAGFSRLKRIL